MLDCSCNRLTHAFYREETRKLSDQVKIAKTFGSAVGIVFRATHIEEQSEPGELCNPRKPCQSCTPGIGLAIVEEGLRPQKEYDDWFKKRQDVFNKCGPKCTNAAACANGFDLSPL